MQNYWSTIPAEVLVKAGNVKLLITDVDGVLTDGGIIYDNQEMEFKRYNVKDGAIVHYLKKNKILIGAITGRNSKVVENRCEELKFDFHYHGVHDKSQKFAEIMETLELEPEEVAYIGDDLIDLQLLKQVGFSVCPKDAMYYIHEHVDFVSNHKGGQGVFREVADIILHSKGLLEPIIQSYLKEKS